MFALRFFVCSYHYPVLIFFRQLRIEQMLKKSSSVCSHRKAFLGELSDFAEGGSSREDRTLRSRLDLSREIAQMPKQKVCYARLWSSGNRKVKGERGDDVGGFEG